MLWLRQYYLIVFCVKVKLMDQIGQLSSTQEHKESQFYFPRTKPTKSYLQRKIEQYQIEAWGPEKRELDLRPHLGKLERELQQLKQQRQNQQQEMETFDEEQEVRKLVDEVFAAITKESPAKNQLTLKVHRSKLQVEQEEFWRSLQQQNESNYSTRLTFDDENRCQNSIREFGGSLGDILKVHKSSLEKYQEQFRKQQAEYEQLLNEKPLDFDDQICGQQRAPQQDISGQRRASQDCSLFEMAQYGGNQQEADEEIRHENRPIYEHNIDEQKLQENRYQTSQKCEQLQVQTPVDEALAEIIVLKEHNNRYSLPLSP
eukprot:TRINITY_DN409_c0_g1_i6.p1 TRINITY_DN409_c0_g1~~TRINITY_DN409_c0_g1_i6.p1  ORF type:complete len:316 (+),score=46.48 TRINITY_DN409_c0_g1_i6:312-1259(+)